MREPSNEDLSPSNSRPESKPSIELSKTNEKNELNIDQPPKKLMTLQHKITVKVSKSSLNKEAIKIREIEKAKELYQIYLYNLKDVIFFFSLLLSSSVNFSYPYLPLILIGLSYIFLLGYNNNCSKNLKLTFEFIALIYSIILIIFKLVCIAMIKNENEYILENQNLFKDLGICYLRDTESNFYFFISFLGESVLACVSFYGIIISSLFSDFDEFNEEKKIWKSRNLIILDYVFTLCFATFNVSYSTLFYMVLLQIVFLFDSVMCKKFARIALKVISYFFALLISIQLFIINLFNIPKFQEKFLYEKDKEYSIWTKIGINYAFNSDLIYFFKEWTGYFFMICSLICLFFTIRVINNSNDSSENENKKILEQKDDEKEEKEEKEEKSKITLFFSNIINSIKNFFNTIFKFIVSPSFIIQLCKIMSIFWMYFYRNYYSLGIFITLFFSFLFVNVSSNKYLTIFLLAPVVFISLISFHISNIKGNLENLVGEEKVIYSHLALGKYEYTFLEYLIGNVFYIFIMFLIYSFYHTSSDEEENENKKNFKPEISNASNNLSTPLLQPINDDDNKNKIKIVVDKGNDHIKNLSFVNIILKTIFSHIDKITLVVMYFVAVKSINVTHLILVIIFLIQIILPSKIKNLFEFILCILQFLFLIEYVADLIKVHYFDEFNNNKDFLNFLIIYSDDLNDNTLEIFIYGVVYCFYFQYQIYNFPFIKSLIENQKLTLANYVEYKFQNFKRIKKFLFILGKIIMELYKWVLIGLFVTISCYFEISLIFEIKLILFFILCFKFFVTFQSPKIKTSISFLKYLFLVYCCLNTLLVYLYQFVADDFINYKPDIYESKNFYIKNIANIGFTMYDTDYLYYHLLPHFLNTFIAVLFIWEISDELEQIYKKQLIINNDDDFGDEDIKTIKKEDDIDIKLKNDDLTVEEREQLLSEKYDRNSAKLSRLTKKYLAVNIIKLITKFYWLLLFLTIGIIFSSYDLSYSMVLYYIIFAITFISMFHRIIIKLKTYIQRRTYFISKVIRYSIVENPLHIEQNKYYRSRAFRFLLAFSFLFFILLYTYGVFDLFQHGCNDDFFKGCDPRHEPIISPDDEEHNTTETYIKAYAYLFGIYVNIRNEGLLNAVWFHLLFSILIGFDVYSQKLENHFTDMAVKIKKTMQFLSNQNNELNHAKVMNDTNILIKIGFELAGIDSKKYHELEKKKYEEKKNSSRNATKEDIITTSDNKNNENNNENNNNIIDTNNNKNNESNSSDDGIQISDNSMQHSFLKNNKIKKFLNIFVVANDNKQTLSDANNKGKIMLFLKKTFEELIIFLLFCIALSKLNFLTFVYLAYTIYLVSKPKTMYRFYILYCFLLIMIFIQLTVYTSNINEATSPIPNEELLLILKLKLNLPWYPNYFSDKYGFFLGLGVTQSQNVLILLEFVQIMVIYIYLDYFSYSIYQGVTNKGEGGRKSKNEEGEENDNDSDEIKESEEKNKKIKFNFGSIKVEPRLENELRYMDKSLFDQYRDCLRNNFDFDIGDHKENLLDKLDIPLFEKKKKNKISNENKDNANDLLKLHNRILSNLTSMKRTFTSNREILEKEGKLNDFIANETESFASYQELIYLYFHCFILIFIMIISLMITGLMSIFYIVISFYYLMNSDAIFLGHEYGYPRAIKKFIRGIIIFDIILQAIYQIPFISPDQDSTLYYFFNALGLIKLIDYVDYKDAEGNDKIEIIINSSQILEVIGKALVYFFLSLQIIIYNSKNFRRYYLSFLLNQKYEFTKISLINTFKFNNKRFEGFIESLRLRINSSKAMDDLKKILEDWNKKLKISGGGLFNEENENLEENGSDKNILAEQKISVIAEKENVDRESSVNDMKLDTKKSIKGKKFLDVDTVKKKIKDKLLSGKIVKFYLWFHKYACSYKSMPLKDRSDYERDCILGNIKINTILETNLEKQLSLLKLDNFDEKEMEIIEDFFDKYISKKIYQEIDKKNAEIEKAKKSNNNEPITYMIKKGDEEININDIKFRQFEYILKTQLFTTYLTNKYQIFSIIYDFISLLMNNFSWFCYFIMILDHMINASLITLFYPISIFCYAILENPRPSQKYWKICFYYTIFILSSKFVFELKLFTSIFYEESYQEFVNWFDNYKIGYKYFESAYSSEFLRYIVCDALVMIVLCINRNILIANGLWNKREEEIENIYQASERILINKDRVFDTPEQAGNMVKNILFYKPDLKNKPNPKFSENAGEEDGKNNIDNNSNEKENISNNENNDVIYHGKFPLSIKEEDLGEKYNEAKKKYYEKLFPKIRNEKPGTDFYPFYTVTLALIVIYILFFFTNMDQDKTYGAVNLDTTQFSGNMVLFLLFHVIILVYDRAIYISQNKDHLKYEYFIYKKSEKGLGELISNEEFKTIKEKIKEKYPHIKKKNFTIPPYYIEKLTSENYNILCVQTELFNKPLLHKYVLHLVITIISHICIFFYFPMKGNYNLGNTIYCTKEDLCNDFGSNYITIIFYIIYIIYLILSGLQIKLGYYDIKRKSLLKANTDSFTTYLAKTFNAIPFLPELRNTIDWTFTSTCFDFFRWNKFESIYDTIFDTYCDNEGIDENPIGEKISTKSKITMGGTLSFILVFILVIPLILFSSLNPTNKLNNITGAKLNVDLTFTYENGAVLNYNIFENSRAKTISDMFKDGDESTWEKYNYGKSVQTRNFNHEQIQIIKFSETSDRNWDLAYPHIQDLIELLNITENNGISTIELTIGYELTRPLPAEAQTCTDSDTILIYDSENDDEDSDGYKKILAFKNAIENCENMNLFFENAYSPPLRLTAGTEISNIEDDKYIEFKNVSLGFQGCEIQDSEVSYLKSYFTFKTINNLNQTDGLEFHTFSDKISETTQGYSVLTFYITFVLVAGSYVQDFLSSEPEKIMLSEMPHPESIINLCEGIKISRYSYEFKKEEYLYTILIELMRSPDYLKLLTQSSIDNFKIREENNKNEDEEENEENEESKENSENENIDNENKNESNGDNDEEQKNLEKKDEDKKDEDITTGGGENIVNENQNNGNLNNIIENKEDGNNENKDNENGKEDE